MNHRYCPAHLVSLLCQVSSILQCEELRSSSGYKNSGLSLHRFPLDRLPLSRKHCEWSLKNCEESNRFLQIPFFHIVLKGSRFCNEFVHVTKERSSPAPILNVVFTQSSSHDHEAKKVYFSEDWSEVHSSPCDFPNVE